ncbi:MAG: UTP--glucose-1-phosphate uridylyltransferase [Coriobacteriales bacterium]|nr:UTP--glucose-1-phosphate uridylyltransferase [Coriobacteriales bacterium]
MKAVIPAAGMGTRFLPATKVQPKEMLLVKDRPCIQYVVEEALAAGSDEVVLINSRDKKSIEQHFAPSPALERSLRDKGKAAYADAVAHAGSLPVSYVYQDAPLGLGHAIHCAAEKTGDEPFYILLGDVIVPGNDILPRMLEVHREHGGASVIAVMPVPDDQVSRFGIIGGVDLGDGVWKVERLVEKPRLEDAPSNLSIFGRYLLTPRVMELLAQAKPSVGGEIQLTDSMDALLQEQEMYAVVVEPGQGLDTGTIETWLEANIVLALQDPQLGPRIKDFLAGL